MREGKRAIYRIDRKSQLKKPYQNKSNKHKFHFSGFFVKSLTTQAARACCMCSGRGSFYLAFFYLASRIFLSFYLASRIFLSRISHFSLKKNFALKFISHLACPFWAPYYRVALSHQLQFFEWKLTFVFDPFFSAREGLWERETSSCPSPQTVFTHSRQNGGLLIRWD